MVFNHEVPLSLSLSNQPSTIYRQLRTLQSGKVDKYGSAYIAASEYGWECLSVWLELAKIC